MEGNVLHYKVEDIVEDPLHNFPAVPLELIEALESRFPDRCPDLRTPEREVWAATGRAEVVRFLREAHQNPKL